MTRIAHFSLLIALVCSLAGCSTAQTQRTIYLPEASIQGLVEDRSHFPTLLYIRPGAAEIGSYDRYIVGDVRIRLSDSDAGKIPAKDMEYMANYLKVAIRHELSQAGYSVGAGYANKALRMDFVLSGFEILGKGQGDASASDQDRSTGAWLSSMRVSTLIVEGDFIDAKANRVDAIAVSRTKPQGFENARWWSTWEDVERSLDEWAVGIREAVNRTRTRKSFPN